MAPKKKGGKKANDDWDEGLGETPDPIAAAAAVDDAAPADGDEEGGNMGGGLLAALKKNRKNKQKKGKAVEDWVEGEDPPGANGEEGAEEVVSLADKAPVEASMEDEDVFAAPVKKGKGAKGAQQKKEEESKAEAEDEDGEDDGAGRVKTKKEKEREKKEREKQRKKEQVRGSHEINIFRLWLMRMFCLGREEEDRRPSTVETRACKGSRKGRGCGHPRASHCGWRQEEEASPSSCRTSETTGRAEKTT